MLTSAETSKTELCIFHLLIKHCSTCKNLQLYIPTMQINLICTEYGRGQLVDLIILTLLKQDFRDQHQLETRQSARKQLLFTCLW